MSDQREPGRSYQVPNEANTLAADMVRMRLATTSIGSDVATLVTQMAGKAATVHAHAIADVTGLQTALDSKSATTHTHALGQLSDVSTVGAVDFQVLARISGSWQPWTINLANITGLAGTYVPQNSATGAATIPVGTTAQRPGSPVSGMIRRNTDLSRWEGWDGSAWNPLTGSVAIFAPGSATATGGQTVFTVPGGYTPGAIEVFRNGVRLTPASYTATNGTSITLGTGAVAGDVIAWVSYNAFAVADVLRRSINLGDLTNIPLARQNLGATVTGSDLFTAASVAAARTTLGLGQFATQITDWNTATTNGWWMGLQATNAPEAGNIWFMGHVVAHNANYCTQYLHRFADDTATDSMSWKRQLNNGAWGSWERLRESQAELDARYTRLAYESPQQTITAGGLVTLAHGLGARPKLVQCVLVCASSSNGFSTGDEVAIGPITLAGAAYLGATVYMTDTTNILIRIARDGVGVHDTSGILTSATVANWRLVVRAYA